MATWLPHFSWPEVLGLLTGTALLVYALRRRRQHRSTPAPWCGRCGYSLHGRNDAAHCPECGQSLLPDGLVWPDTALHTWSRRAIPLTVGWFLLALPLHTLLEATVEPFRIWREERITWVQPDWGTLDTVCIRIGSRQLVWPWQDPAKVAPHFQRVRLELEASLGWSIMEIPGLVLDRPEPALASSASRTALVQRLAGWLEECGMDPRSSQVGAGLDELAGFIEGLWSGPGPAAPAYAPSHFHAQPPSVTQTVGGFGVALGGLWLAGWTLWLLLLCRQYRRLRARTQNRPPGIAARG